MLVNIQDVIKSLEVVKNLGWVKTLRSGSTGIGYTLETLLEIAENNLQQPDLMGFELKASRLNGSSMLTMFTLSPNPPRSNSVLREKYGYISGDYIAMVKHMIMVHVRLKAQITGSKKVQK